MNNLVLKNPKRATEKEHRAKWYNYYAGFSHTFVRDILAALDLSPDALILDPWNGAGSSTLAAALEGYNSIGIDLNPAMLVIAKAKLASHTDVELAIEKAKRFRVSVVPQKLLDDDYLLHWFSKETANYLRYMSFFVHKISKDNLQNITVSDSLIYLALFNVVRTMVSKFIPSNPMWVKKSQSGEGVVHKGFREIKNNILAFLFDARTEMLGNDVKERVELYCASSTEIPIKSDCIDAIVSSPPYCTRIDYGVATSPELAIMFGHHPKFIDEVRRSLIGRTTIDKTAIIAQSYGDIADSFLDRVLSHDSHASSTYYYKNLQQYFYGIEKSISEVCRVLKRNGYFVCVVQDSYYKEVYCDLAGVVTELSKKYKMNLIKRTDFDARMIMANIHTLAKKYRGRITAMESVLIFKSNG